MTAASTAQEEEEQSEISLSKGSLRIQNVRPAKYIQSGQ